MHIPNERVYTEMRSEIASLWYVPTNNGQKAAFLIKAPTPSLKAMIAGCPIQLVFGKQDSYLCIGIRIEDMPDTPIFISGIQKEYEEHIALVKSIEQGTIPIFLFNEMDICIGSSLIEIKKSDVSDILNFVGDEKMLYVGIFDEKASYVLDCFGFSVGEVLRYPNACEIPIIQITPNIGKWKTNDVYFIGNGHSQKINLANKDEGGTFENTIWASLESVFPTGLYQSPKVKKGNNFREFTDVFAYYEYGSFMIEAKDLSVIQAGYDKDESKRLAGIQKQVKKAIKQLVGAVSAFNRGDILFNAEEKEIIVDRSQPPHCIILITELMFCGDWDDITNQLCCAMKQTGAFFHILDLRELITILKKSSGDPRLIDYNLMQRCNLCIEKNSIFVRGI